MPTNFVIILYIKIAEKLEIIANGRGLVDFVSMKWNILWQLVMVFTKFLMK